MSNQQNSTTSNNYSFNNQQASANYSFSPSSSSSQAYTYPVTGINGNAGTISISGASLSSLTCSKLVYPKKSKIKYAIVKSDGTYNVLNEQNPITPRQLLAITKFIFCAQMSNSDVKFDWEALVSELGISEHFTNCATLDNSSDTFYCKLY